MGDVFLRKYAAATTVDFALYETDGTDLKTDAASATGDITLYRDEALVETLDADAFVDEGAIYSLALSAAEMTAARIIVCVVDQGTKAWLDKTFIVETYGHASAMHAFDLSVATQPVNITQIGGVVQSLTDLKDFADTGYDPAAHKVAGVVLVDTTTTNTDMLTAAAVNAEVDTALNTAVPAVNTANSVNDLLLDQIDVVADAIKAKTDLLPSDPADESLIEAAITAAHATTDGKIDAVDNYVDTEISTLVTNVAAILKIQKNKWAISGTTLTYYDDDGVTPLYQFTLDSGTEPTSRTPV